MATATFEKRIIIDQKDADFLVRELEKTPVGPLDENQNFITENERETAIWLSGFEK